MQPYDDPKYVRQADEHKARVLEDFVPLIDPAQNRPESAAERLARPSLYDIILQEERKPWYKKLW